MPELLYTFRSRLVGPQGAWRGRWPQWALRVLAFALIGIGALGLLDGAVTLVWQEPISALYAEIRQEHLSGALRTIERAAPTPVEQRALASLSDEQSRITYLARELEHRASAGSAVGRIVIPSIGASFVVVKGTSAGALQGGPGIYHETGFPGIPGTTAIAGHRTTYLAPFRHIDALHRGNRILLNMPYAQLTYSVIGQRIVRPTNVQAAVANVGYTRLVLSACTPLFSAEKRILVYGRLVRIVPVGAARELPGGALVQPIQTPQPSAARPPQHPLPAVLEPLQPHLLPPLNE